MNCYRCPGSTASCADDYTACFRKSFISICKPTTDSLYKSIIGIFKEALRTIRKYLNGVEIKKREIKTKIKIRTKNIRQNWTEQTI